jgi:hypothetical protein
MTFKRNNKNGTKFKRGNGNGNGKNHTNGKKNGNGKKKRKEKWEIILESIRIGREEGYITGRPTKYHPRHPELAIEFLAAGHSKTALAAILDITYTTLLDWEANKSEFSEAVQIGLTKSQRTWEDKGLDQCSNGKFNDRVYALVMSNRFGYNSNKVSIDSRNEIKHEGEVKIDADPKGRAAAILDVLLQSGCFKPEAIGSPDTEDDEVHNSRSES